MFPTKTGSPPYSKPSPCKGCVLFGNGKGFGFSSFGGTNNVLIVTDMLTEQQTDQKQTGEFLTGPAGWQLNHVFKRAGLKREDFAGVESVIHCRPPMGKLSGQAFESQATRHCSGYLDHTIDQIRPKAIIALGNTALRRVAGQTGIGRSRGFIFEGVHDIPVIGTFSPNYLLPKRGEKSASKYTWVMVMDFRKAIRVAKGERKLYPQQYLLDPSPDRAMEFMREFERVEHGFMTWDLETLYKLKQKNEQKLKLENKQVITRISFAFRPGYAMTIPWDPIYLEKIIDPFFRSNCPKVDWNGLGFDRPIILLQERKEVNGTLYDAMDMFHTFQPNIERNLEFATSILCDHLKPWKHLSQSEPEWYSAQDSDAQISNFLQLREIMSQVEVPEYD